MVIGRARTSLRILLNGCKYMYKILDKKKGTKMRVRFVIVRGKVTLY